MTDTNTGEGKTAVASRLSDCEYTFVMRWAGHTIEDLQEHACHCIKIPAVNPALNASTTLSKEEAAKERAEKMAKRQQRKRK